MIRRTFLIVLLMMGVGSLALLTLGDTLIRRIFYKIESLFKQPVEILPESEREEIELPSKGYFISVETALNSRCTSDYDENPKKFHWGMFDRTKKLSDTKIIEIIDLAKIPQFTDHRINIQVEYNRLSFLVDNQISGIQRDWMMVESGMQQQAVGLICAALGIGMVFNGLGDDGSVISSTDLATVDIKLDAMKPTYNGSYWTSSSPNGLVSSRRGNLPDPVRDGNKPLISSLKGLMLKNDQGKEANDKSVSQLLWAARGRTSHYYKSRPWGMTIPVSRGDQEITSVYLLSRDIVFRYVNWHRMRPSHSIENLGEIVQNFEKIISKFFDFSNSTYIILDKNENSGRAFWEIGYQLLNLLLQAQALNLVYEAILLNKKQKEVFQSVGIKDPVAAFVLNLKS
jgi:hypothetical protein